MPNSVSESNVPESDNFLSGVSSAHSELIEALEKATGPDRELDEKISIVSGKFHIEKRNHDYRRNMPHYTASIDAALTLVPGGWFVTIQNHVDQITSDNEGHTISRQKVFNHCFAWVQSKSSRYGHAGATPAIALCIAALRARAALEGTK